MKTKLHTYYFNCGVIPQCQAYLLLCEQMKKESRRADRIKFVNTDNKEGNNFSHLPILEHREWFTTHEIDLDLAHIFDDQWNSATTDKHSGYRVFDWVEYYQPSSKSVIWGHWLEVTDEMVDARNFTLRCGYCHQHYGHLHESHLPKPTDMNFCSKCLGSPYLKESELYMLRLTPISRRVSGSLSDKESEWLLPRYVEAQVNAKSKAAKAKAEEQRTRLEKDREVDAMKYDGLDRLLKAEIDISNVIFHGHVPTFKFGWRSPLSPSVADHFKQRLAEIEFPHPTEFEIAQ
jgi:hypothetical protein